LRHRARVELEEGEALCFSDRMDDETVAPASRLLGTTSGAVPVIAVLTVYAVIVSGLGSCVETQLALTTVPPVSWAARFELSV